MLVVLGHALQQTIGQDCFTNHLWNAIYSFHMPAFMAISGYLTFRIPEIGRARCGCKSLIYRRFRQLVLPFIIWTLILIITKKDLSVKSIVDYLLFPDKGLWFLWVLFFISVFFICGCWLSDLIKVKQEYVIFIICLLLIGIMVLFEPRIFGFQFIAYYFLFYSIGYYLHKYDTLITRSRVLLLCLLACWCLLAWFWQMHSLPTFLQITPVLGSIIQYIYRFITALIAIFFLLSVSPRVLNSAEQWNEPFNRLGRFSLGIYTAHFILMRYFVSAFISVGLSNSSVVILSFVFGVLFSWLLVWLLNKWRVTAIWLLGKV